MKEVNFFKNPFLKDHISYTNRNFMYSWGDEFPGNHFEKYLIDEFDHPLKKLIYEIFNDYFSKFENKDLSIIDNPNENSELKRDLFYSAQDTSFALKEVLPFRGYSNFIECEKDKENIINQQKEKYSNYSGLERKVYSFSRYLDSLSDDETLSSLTQKGNLICTSQGLLIKESLGLNNLELFHLKYISKGDYNSENLSLASVFSDHGFVAFPIGDYFLILDALAYNDKISYEESPSRFLYYKKGFNKQFRNYII